MPLAPEPDQPDILPTIDPVLIRWLRRIIRPRRSMSPGVAPDTIWYQEGRQSVVEMIEEEYRRQQEEK